MAESPITPEYLNWMFTSMRRDTKWNVNGPLLWGYFFTDHSASRLQKAAEFLAAQGYRVVDIFPSDADGEKPGVLFLHVERVEQHTEASLHARNTELAEFAAALQLGSYDGMDVGPVTH
jgi:hypothetical protein